MKNINSPTRIQGGKSCFKPLMLRFMILMAIKSCRSFDVAPRINVNSILNLNHAVLKSNYVNVGQGFGFDRKSTIVLSKKSNSFDCENSNTKMDSQINRREMWQKSINALSIPLFIITSNDHTAGSSAFAVERAVGSAEKSCREEGNCLEKGDWDGAVGWNWGGKDRCDATDPRCGIDGKLKDAPPTGDPVPDKLGLTITHEVKIVLSIGKSEKGTLKIGLYGNNAPIAVAQIVDFLDPRKGLLTTSKLALDEGYGVSSAPISLAYSGILNVIYPNQRLDFGILSQQIAYGKRKNISRIPENFIPQPRPTKNQQELMNEPSVRLHDTAGLFSIPSKGLGYGGTGFEPEDEAFASAFQITSTAVPSMDGANKENRKVIGQLLDQESMALLARLSSLPTKKGLKGIIPGQNYGPPLLKVQVLNVSVEPSQITTVVTDQS